MSKEINNISIFVGRLNPMTIYHKDLIVSNDIDLVFITQTEDNSKNPLSAMVKYAATGSALPGRIILECKDVIEALKKTTQVGSFLAKDEITITLHCGSDRSSVYKRLNTYSKEIGFKELVVVSHNRDNEKHSATHLRQLALEGKQREFNNLCGYCVDWKKIAYDVIRNKYGCVQG